MRRGLEHALDEYLVLSAQAGSREAFTQLARRWTPKLKAFAARVLAHPEAAQDVVQETWVSAWRGLSGLDDPARWRAWLYAIAHRKCTDALRAKYRGQRLANALGEDMEQTSGDEAGRAAARLDLTQAMARLPPEQRIAVSLYFGEEMSVAEIAEATGAPVGTVKSRLFAARQALRGHLEGEVT
ncbi:MAG TPA: sigma-70 family RNA polymerase sigma factor [Terricaulis sp.]|mgnify:CR=1 FL=1|nr:sigma-70 family RNA polymerase sigma factor [Terricaulis sp.]